MRREHRRSDVLWAGTIRLSTPKDRGNREWRPDLDATVNSLRLALVQLRRPVATSRRFAHGVRFGGRVEQVGAHRGDGLVTATGSRTALCVAFAVFGPVHGDRVQQRDDLGELVVSSLVSAGRVR